MATPQPAKVWLDFVAALAAGSGIGSLFLWLVSYAYCFGLLKEIDAPLMSSISISDAIWLFLSSDSILFIFTVMLGQVVAVIYSLRVDRFQSLSRTFLFVYTIFSPLIIFSYISFSGDFSYGRLFWALSFVSFFAFVISLWLFPNWTTEGKFTLFSLSVFFVLAASGCSGNEDFFTRNLRRNALYWNGTSWEEVSILLTTSQRILINRENRFQFVDWSGASLLRLRQRPDPKTPMTNQPAECSFLMKYMSKFPNKCK
jgi:hypothetical protein